jgi:hypothetical protein
MITYQFIIELGKLVLLPFSGNNKVKIFVVITIIPLFSNALQFWLTDNVIKIHHSPDEVQEYINKSMLEQSQHNYNVVEKTDIKDEKILSSLENKDN